MVIRFYRSIRGQFKRIVAEMSCMYHYSLRMVTCSEHYKQDRDVCHHWSGYLRIIYKYNISVTVYIAKVGYIIKVLKCLCVDYPFSNVLTSITVSLITSNWNESSILLVIITEGWKKNWMTCHPGSNIISSVNRDKKGF